MNTENSSPQVIEDSKVDVKLKLASLWTCFMFLYIYVDYFALYMPNKIQDILKGTVFVFDISQEFLSIALVSVSLPAMMIPLSVVLSAKVNRIINLVIAMIYIPYTLFNLAGEAWVHMVYGAVLECVLLAMIIRYAWTWPRVKA